MESCKWFKDGSTKYEGYRITPYDKEWFETDTHWIMTKENSTTNLRPKRKFKIAWTEEMKNSLKETGWRFATPEEIKYLKLEDQKIRRLEDQKIRRLKNIKQYVSSIERITQNIR